MNKLEAHSPLTDSKAVFGWVDADESAYVTFAFDCEAINRSQNAFCDNWI